MTDDKPLAGALRAIQMLEGVAPRAAHCQASERDRSFILQRTSGLERLVEALDNAHSMCGTSPPCNACLEVKAALREVKAMADKPTKADREAALLIAKSILTELGKTVTHATVSVSRYADHIAEKMAPERERAAREREVGDQLGAAATAMRETHRNDNDPRAPVAWLQLLAALDAYEALQSAAEALDAQERT